VSAFRVRRQGRFWRVQERVRFLWLFWRWQYIGPYGCAEWGKWTDFHRAIWFANFCEQQDAKSLSKPKERV